MTALFAAIVVAVIGLAICWSNPVRVVNRLACTCSLHIAIWLGCLYLARTPPTAGLFWLRITCMTGAMLPLHFALVQEGIIGRLRDIFRNRPITFAVWGVATFLLAGLPFTDYFIPSYSTPEVRVYGWAYKGFIWMALGLCACLLVDAMRQLRGLIGAARLELQVWLFGGSLTVSILVVLMALNLSTGEDTYIKLQPLVVLIFYSGTIYAVTTYRIFDSRYLLLTGSRKLVVVLVAAGLGYYLDKGLRLLLAVPEPYDFIMTTAIVLWFALEFNGWLDRRAESYPEAAAARQAAFDAAKRELTMEGLEFAFVDVLRGWGRTDQAIVLSGPKEEIRGCGIELTGRQQFIDVIRRTRWVTPERLAREKSTPEGEELKAFLKQHRLGALVCSRGFSLTVLVGVGHTVSHRPYTYPQVMQLVELAAIMESAMERAHFSSRAQQAERLATVGLLGAGVAHEIRNPLVTIKTFVQLLPQRHQEEGFRRKFFQLISEEITRIDRLTERLMELGSPRSYFMVPQPLHPLVRGTLELVEPKAADHGVDIATDFQAGPDVIDTDAAAARQVLLNLCLNAVHAMENVSGPRRIRLATRNVPGGVEVCITDTGPGLASEMLPRLFTPFQSTKSTGFGLGLAISSEIMSGLRGTIVADPPRAGEGATFRLIFPCPSPSS